MSAHLRHNDLIDALDGTASAAARAHLTDCEACRADVDGLRATVRDAREVEVPAPSPLFWDHFSDRVRRATAGEPVPAPDAWWRAWWRPAGVVAAAAGALALVLVLRTPPPAVPSGSAAAGVGALVDDGSWGLVIGLATELDAADVREAAKPAEGTADAMIAELSEAQRTALARMLQEDMGER